MTTKNKKFYPIDLEIWQNIGQKTDLDLEIWQNIGQKTDLDLEIWQNVGQKTKNWTIGNDTDDKTTL